MQKKERVVRAHIREQISKEYRERINTLEEDKRNLMSYLNKLAAENRELKRELYRQSLKSPAPTNNFYSALRAFSELAKEIGVEPLELEDIAEEKDKGEETVRTLKSLGITHAFKDGHLYYADGKLNDVEDVDRDFLDMDDYLFGLTHILFDIGAVRVYGSSAREDIFSSRHMWILVGDAIVKEEAVNLITFYISGQGKHVPLIAVRPTTWNPKNRALLYEEGIFYAYN